MKVRLKKDWLGFEKGYEIEDTDGVFEFISTSDDVSENSTSSSNIYISLNLDAVRDNQELFEIVEDKSEKEDSSIRSEKEVREWLSQIYKDINMLKSLTGADSYVQILENMAYALEWVLGNIEFKSKSE